jgi:hypothetical protein
MKQRLHDEIWLTISAGVCYGEAVSPEIPRQKNMFSGEWDDPRSAKQRQLDDERARAPGTQIPMFGEQELRPSTANVQPQIDPMPMPDHLPFAELLLDTDTLLADNELEIDSESDGAIMQDNRPARTKYELYFDLVRWSQEHAETLWIDPVYAARYEVEIAILCVEARSTGLTDSEIEAARKIGEWHGDRHKQYQVGSKE